MMEKEIEMNKREYTIIEKMAIYLAERSCGKSIPMFSHKVEKPQNIEKALGKVKDELSLEDMKNSAD